MSVFSPTHINYLQRDFIDSSVTEGRSSMFCGIRDHQDIRLLHVQGILDDWKDHPTTANAVRQLVTDFWAGLNAEHIPSVFMVLGTLNRISVFVGAFRDSEQWPWPLSSAGVDGDIATIIGGLSGAFPGVRCRICTDQDWSEIYRIIRLIMN